MKELDVVRFLLDEIEKQTEYNKQYEIEVEKAQKQADKYNKDMPSTGNKWCSGRSYLYYIPKEFTRSPNKSVIKINAMKIRKLMLGLYGRDES